MQHQNHMVAAVVLAVLAVNGGGAGFSLVSKLPNPKPDAKRSIERLVAAAKKRAAETESAAEQKAGGQGDADARNHRREMPKEQVRRGMQRVTATVSRCRQRQSRRGIPLSAGKVYLTLHVEPTGAVSRLAIEPSRLRGTVFERCLQIRMGGWDFGSWNGRGQTLDRMPLVLQ